MCGWISVGFYECIEYMFFCFYMGFGFYFFMFVIVYDFDFDFNKVVDDLFYILVYIVYFGEFGCFNFEEWCIGKFG